MNGESPAIPPEAPAQAPEQRLVRKISPVLYGFIVLGVVFILYQGLGAVISFLLFGVKVTDDNVQLMRVVSILGQFLFLLLPSVFLARLQGWEVKKLFRLNLPDWREVLLVLAAVSALQIVMQVYLVGQDWLMQHILMPETLKPMIEQIKKMINDLYTKLVFARSPLELGFIVIVIGLTPAICEEALFRGIVQGSFEKGMKAGWSIILSGCIFAMFHLNPFAFVPLSVLGIYFSFIVWRGDSIYLAMIAHFFNNSMAAVFLYFLGTDAIMIPSQSGSDLSSPVLLANLTGGLSVFLIATFFFWKVSARRAERSAPSPGGPSEVLSQL